MKLRSKKIAAICCAAVMAVTCAIPAFASSYRNYAVTNASPTGRDVDLGTSQKAYTFRMSGPGSAAVTLQLWQKRYFGDQPWPRDQTFTPKSSNQTAWWYGYQDAVATYHITGDFIGDNGQSIVLNGTFYNR